jgi:hypothetical protein
MERLENRFLIYDGFNNDASLCFKGIIQKFNFKIIDVSNYGAHFINDRCILDIVFETGGIQMWLKIPKYNISEMIPKLCMYKGDKIIDEYNNIVRKGNSKETMLELSSFLETHFSEELKEN